MPETTGYPYEANNGSAAQSASMNQYESYPSNGPEDGLLNSSTAGKTPWYKNKWFWIPAAILAVAIGVGVGVGVGVTHSKNHSSDSSSSSSSSDGNDPSKFTKNPNLHMSLWGLSYTPQGSLLPDCGADIGDVIKDVQAMSQLTTRLRLYGSDCNVSALVLDAIQQTKVNMTVWIGIYLETDITVYQRQRDTVIAALKSFGTDNINGVIVGNEYLLNQAGSGGTEASTTDIDFVVAQMADFRTALSNNSLKALPVGTGDAGSEIVTSLAAGADFIMANVHPFFAGVTVDQAASWTYEYFAETPLAQADAATNKPPTYLAETGWPSSTMANSSFGTVGGAVQTNSVGSSYGAAVPGLSEVQTLMDNWVCAANTNVTNGVIDGYFWFEAFDEPWKEMYGGVEPYWGVFDSNRNIKNLTIPTCISP